MIIVYYYLDVLVRFMGAAKAQTNIEARLAGGFDVGARFEQALEWDGGKNAISFNTRVWVSFKNERKS